MARLLLVGSLVLVACSSRNRVDTAFEKLEGALPPLLHRVDQEGNSGARSARYEATGEPHEVAAAVRSSFASQGFTMSADAGLPDPSVTQPAMPPGETPATVALPTTTIDPPAVDAIHVGFGGELEFGLESSLYFHPGPRPGSTVVIVSVSHQT